MPKVYCSRRCQKRARERRRAPVPRAPVPPVTVVTLCAECGVLTDRPRMCSRRCVERAKARRRTERYRQDPAYASKVLQRHAAWRYAQGAQRADAPVPKTCPACGAFFQATYRRVYCTPTCRAQAGRAREAGRRECQPLTLLALVSWAGNTHTCSVECRIAIGVLVKCPTCQACMGATSPDQRTCVCGTTVVLNPEEVAWVCSPYGLAAK